jgi:hypothetical protein
MRRRTASSTPEVPAGKPRQFSICVEVAASSQDTFGFFVLLKVDPAVRDPVPAHEVAQPPAVGRYV